MVFALLLPTNILKLEMRIDGGRLATRIHSLLNKSSVVRVVDVTNNWWGVFVVVSGGMS